MKNLQVALVGYGAGGRIYNAPMVEAVEGLVVTCILTSDPQKIKLAKQEFPQAKVVQDYDLLLKDTTIDLVIITVPNHLHRETASKALRAGKHVVVEKPFTVTTEDAEELISLAKECNRIISVNHNRRWDSDIRTIKKVLEEGRLGRVVEFEAHFDRFRPELKDSWKEENETPGSGLLYDLGSHLIDQALWLFGDPQEIFAHLRIQRPGSQVVDNFELLLLYPDLKVTLKAGMLVKQLGPRYQIFGTKGSYTKTGMDVQEEALKNGLRPEGQPNWGQEPKEIWGHLQVGEKSEPIPSLSGDYRVPYRNIRHAILGTEELLVTPKQAMKVIQIIELAYRSNSEKRILPTGY